MSSNSPDLIRELHRISRFGVWPDWISKILCNTCTSRTKILSTVLSSMGSLFSPQLHEFMPNGCSTPNFRGFTVSYLRDMEDSQICGHLRSPCSIHKQQQVIQPMPKANLLLMAEKVGSASHFQERKGGSSWKLMEKVNCMQKSVEEGIHISLPFISWGRSLANHPLS